EKFKVNEFKIYESEYWNWSLRPNQSTLGSGILSLKRECNTFSALKLEEFSDLHNIIKIIESSLEKTFKYDIMNYLMLMMIDKQVHYHVIPRYKQEINYNNKKWQDKGWPEFPILQGIIADNEEACLIINAIKNNIDIEGRLKE